MADITFEGSDGEHDIDDGDLDNLSRFECFELGYELAMVEQELKYGAAFAMPLRLDNRKRVELRCKGRNYRIRPMSAELADGWLFLEVDAFH